MHLALVILGIFIALVAVLSIPLILRVSARGCMLDWEYHASLSWLFGLITVDLREKMRRPKKEITKKKSGRMPPIGLIRSAMRLAIRVLALLEIRGRGWLRIGTGDPALTGEIVGYAYSMWGFLSSLLEDVQVRVEPDFIEEAFEGSGDLEFKVRPIRLVPPIFSFLITPEFRRFMLGR